MAKTIYLLQYNNYFNRTVKGETFANPSDYLGAATLCARVDNVTLWNPNDGVDTTFTTNVGITAIPDYALVCEGNTILQRWFVMEAKRLQGQQYRLTMRRDLIVDNYDEILNNTDTYVERGWCDVSNPAIYNQEPLTFNLSARGLLCTSRLTRRSMEMKRHFLTKLLLVSRTNSIQRRSSPFSINTEWRTLSLRATLSSSSLMLPMP